MLGQIIVDQQSVTTALPVVLAHRDAGVGRDELQGRSLDRARRDDRRVLHRSVLTELLDDLGDRRLLLADGDVDAVAGVVRGVLVLLVDDRVERDGGLARLTVADDQLALAAADGHERVDRLQAGLQRLVHRLALNDARGLDLAAAMVLGLDRTLAVDRLAEGVDDATDEGLAHRDLDDAAGTLDRVALANVLAEAEERGADVVVLEVEDHSVDFARELEELTRHGLLEAVDAGDSVADRDDRACLGDFDLLVVVLDLAPNDPADFFDVDVHSLLVWRRRRPRGVWARCLREWLRGSCAAGSRHWCRRPCRRPRPAFRRSDPDRRRSSRRRSSRSSRQGCS